MLGGLLWGLALLHGCVHTFCESVVFIRIKGSHQAQAASVSVPLGTLGNPDMVPNRMPKLADLICFTQCCQRGVCLAKRIDDGLTLRTRGDVVAGRGTLVCGVKLPEGVFHACAARFDRR